MNGNCWPYAARNTLTTTFFRFLVSIPPSRVFARAQLIRFPNGLTFARHLDVFVTRVGQLYDVVGVTAAFAILLNPFPPAVYLVTENAPSMSRVKRKTLSVRPILALWSRFEHDKSEYRSA
jgi:hypothetical protein